MAFRRRHTSRRIPPQDPSRVFNWARGTCAGRRGGLPPTGRGPTQHWDVLCNNADLDVDFESVVAAVTLSEPSSSKKYTASNASLIPEWPC